MSGNLVHVLVYYGGRIVYDQQHGVYYDGPSPTLVQINRGITLGDLQNQLIASKGLGDGVENVRITYRFSTNRYPHANYYYTPLAVEDDNNVNIIFDMAQNIAGYTPELYLEVDELQIGRAHV